MDYQFLKGRSVKMTHDALKKIDNPSTRKACLDYFPIFGAPTIIQVWIGNKPYTNRNVCEYNLTDTYSSDVYIRLSWSRKDSWWLNLNDICFDCGKQRHIFNHNCRHKWTFKFYCC